MRRGVLGLAMVVALFGCAEVPPATTAVAAESAPGAGWRKGFVVQAGDGDSLGPPVDSDCRERAHGAQAPHRYVEVRYFVGRHAHLRIVPIDDALDVVAGDPVWFRSFGCGAARKAAAAS